MRAHDFHYSNLLQQFATTCKTPDIFVLVPRPCSYMLDEPLIHPLTSNGDHSRYPGAPSTLIHHH
jgi:hypothetical protein